MHTNAFVLLVNNLATFSRAKQKREWEQLLETFDLAFHNDNWLRGAGGNHEKAHNGMRLLVYKQEGLWRFDEEGRYCVNESGPHVMLQPHQHFSRDLFRLVFMHEMSGVGDPHHRQVVDELIQPIKILTDECLILYPPDHQCRDGDSRISQPSLTQCPAAS